MVCPVVEVNNDFEVPDVELRKDNSITPLGCVWSDDEVSRGLRPAVVPGTSDCVALGLTIHERDEELSWHLRPSS